MSTIGYQGRRVPVSLTTITDEHIIPINVLCRRFHTNTTRGLGNDQVKRMLKERGKNSFKKPKRKLSQSLAETFFRSYEGKFTTSEWNRLVAQQIPKEVSVVREGKRKIILGKNLVVGDLILLEKSDIVPADIRLIGSKEVKVDNRIITGNTSETRTHNISEATEDCLLSPNMVFSCTKIVVGKCVGIVLRTGEGTVFGTLKNFATKVKVEVVV